MEVIQIVWAVVMVAFIVLEGVTVALVSIWFAFGALLALVSSMFGASIAVQLVIFIVSSVGALIVTIPYSKNLRTRKVETNANALIGQKFILIEKIEFNKPGKVKVKGIEWNAVSDNEINKVNVPVIVVGIDGNKLKVEEEK